MLKSHGRYDFSGINSRPTYEWPDGKRLAVHFSLNIEHFHFGQGLGSNIAIAMPQPNHRSFAWRDYGNRVGVFRILDLLNDLDLPAAMLINTSIYDYAPEIMEAVRARGDEVVGHGRTNSERQEDWSEADERAMLQEVYEAIARHEGTPPTGWLGPWLYQTYATPDLLQEIGYQYMMDWACDDQPIWFRTRAGKILSVPYPLEVNDSPAIAFRNYSAADFADMIIDQFDEMLLQSKNQPLVCGISLHTFIVGQPFRLRQLRRALQHIADRRDDIWLTRPGNIARHVADLPPGTVPGS
jgi:peptidoglycan/xylan/chitin deacetylase (PgdA/CDA1 family)